MKVQVEYLGSVIPTTYLYTFEAPDATRLGDTFRDGQQMVIVRALGSNYDGPCRRLARA